MIDIFGNRRRFVFFDADPDTGGGSAGNSSKAGTGGTGEGNAAKTVQLTQEALDAMFADRAKRGGESAVKSLLEKLGLDKEEDLTVLIGKAKQVEDSQKTELQKVQDELTKAQEKAQKADQEKKDALAQANERLMKVSVLAEATAQSFRPEAISDVWLFIDKAKITEKDGEFTGVKEAVQEVAKAKPWMLADKSKTPGTPPPQSGKKPDGNKQTTDTRPLLRL